MKNFKLVILALLPLIYSCSESSNVATDTEFVESSTLVTKAKEMMALGANPGEVQDFIQMSLEPVSLGFDIPDLQSAAYATYEDQWLIFGGRKSGLHSMNNDPVAFPKLTANDSIWVIDLAQQSSIGFPIPAEYRQFLAAGSMLHYQEGTTLHVSGGFTYTDTTTVSTWTSDRYFEIDIPGMISYVQSGGTSPTFDQVILKEASDPFLQVTGGEMMVSNDNIYLVGGQNYVGAYIPGNNGIYTSALRKFNITGSPGNWVVSGKDSIVDSVRLHRRDYTLAEVITADTDSIGAVVYGGVFTKNDMAYQSPVYINGLGSGQATATLDQQTLQNFNLYSAAKVESVLAFGDSKVNRVSILGGISYQAYNADSGGVYTPFWTLSLPFSNVISTYYTDGESSTIELVQLPPNKLMPGYLGSNAVFFRLSQFLYGDSDSVLDLNKIFPGNETGPVLVGYMFGGIDSPVPNTRVPGKIYPTTTNNTLYGVYMTLQD